MRSIVEVHDHRGSALARISNIERGNPRKPPFGAAASATRTRRKRGARLADGAQEVHERLDDDALDALAVKLRGAVGGHPTASLLAAASLGYLLARLLHR
jgi:hypothetical protein